MNIKYSANTVTVVTEIPVTLFTEAQALAPQSLILKDEKGNGIYGITTGSGCISDHSVSFNAVVGGKLALNVPVEFNTSNEDAAEFIKKRLGSKLAALATNEEALIASMSSALAPISGVMNSIQYDVVEEA